MKTTKRSVAAIITCCLITISLFCDNSLVQATDSKGTNQSTSSKKFNYSRVKSYSINDTKLFDNPKVQLKQALEWVKTDTFQVGSIQKFKNNKYYLYYSLWEKNSSKACIGYATSSKKNGPYTNKGLLVKSAGEEKFSFKNKNGSTNVYDSSIDPIAKNPRVLVDKNQRMWMFYGTLVPGYYILELDSKTGAVKKGQDYYGFKLFGGFTQNNSKTCTQRSRNTTTAQSVPTSSTIPTQYRAQYQAQTTTATSTAQKKESNSTNYNTNYAQQVLEILNSERSKQGLSPLKMNEKAVAAAKVRAKEIVSKFDHTRPNGATPFTALAEANVTYRTAGENIAAGQIDPAAVMKAWMNSSGHKANILNKNFTEVGLACYIDPNHSYKYYWVQLFIG